MFLLALLVELYKPLLYTPLHYLSVGHPPNVWGSLVNNALSMDHSSVVALYFCGSLTPSTQPD